MSRKEVCPINRLIYTIRCKLWILSILSRDRFVDATGSTRRIP